MVIGRSTKFVAKCVMPVFLNVVPICKLPWRAWSQACRIGGQALGARCTASSIIPSNGENRVWRRRFAEGSTIGGSGNGGSGTGVSINRLVSIEALSVAFSMLSIWAAKGVSCSMHELSRVANSSRRRSVLVDVELELGISKWLVDVELVLGTSIVSTGIRSTTEGISGTITCSYATEFPFMFRVISPEWSVPDRLDCTLAQ